MALMVRGLCKRYGRQRALDGVDLTLAGGVVALLGANGSGKSTLLRILATLAQPDGGQIAFEGWSYGKHAQELRAQIGYLPQDMTLPDTLTPYQFLNHLAQLRGGDLDRVITALRLRELLSVPFGRLSVGEVRRVGIAQALLGAPRLLLLDELTRGLDVMERGRVLQLISTSGARLVIFSTHVPEDIERVGAETVILLDGGRVRFCGGVEAMRTAGTSLESAYLALKANT